MKKIKEILELKSKTTTLLLGTFFPFFVAHVVSYSFTNRIKKEKTILNRKPVYAFLYIFMFLVNSIFPIIIILGFYNLWEVSVFQAISYLLFGFLGFFMLTGISIFK